MGEQLRNIETQSDQDHDDDEYDDDDDDDNDGGYDDDDYVLYLFRLRWQAENMCCAFVFSGFRASVQKREKSA